MLSDASRVLQLPKANAAPAKNDIGNNEQRHVSVLLMDTAAALRWLQCDPKLTPVTWQRMGGLAMHKLQQRHQCETSKYREEEAGPPESALSSIGRR